MPDFDTKSRPFEGGYFGNTYLMLFEVVVSCRILYSIVRYLYVSCSGLITSVGEKRANSSAIVYF